MAAPRLRAKLAAPAGPTASEKEEEMKGKGKKADGAPVDPDEDEDQEKNDAGKKGASAAAPGAKALSPERARMKAITTGPSAQAFPTLAAHLAYDTDLSAADAEAVLSAALQDVVTDASEAPVPTQREAASPKGNALYRAMANEAPNPQLGSGGGGKGEAEDEWLAAAKELGLA